MKYSLNELGYVVAFGDWDFDTEVTDEPFNIDTMHLYKKDLDTGEWIYLPDVTDIDTEIVAVNYNWQDEKAYITIADPYQPGPHEFECTEEWTIDECEAAIAGKFATE
jgi:hypothetical protein